MIGPHVTAAPPSNPLFHTVLVANRGEIAVRIMRTLRRLGIRSVAVYSDADARARHVREADRSIRLGPTAAAESYLRIDRVIDAAVASGAQALHPGYGFLSENTALATACADAGIVFIGPTANAIDAMGDKVRAKATVAANGVRVVPGVADTGLTDDELVAAVAAVGYPVLIKPSAGGGGKGMRLVNDASMLLHEVAAARRVALSAFGDDTLLLERFIERPRHIEVQILADGHGNVVHLGERECSLQRRHQKVIEEAPSPLLTDDQRQWLASQAVAAAKACGYVNAGTVEFIVSGADPDEAFFMEMNTRLQVEHPVTEMVWGLDLVEMQLRIAAGEALGFTQSDLAPQGHAIEARVYAEDARAEFLPTGGTVLHLDEPVELEHVRVDSSLLPSTVVGSAYDPMLSKVIAWGPDRDSARRRLGHALERTVVLGVTTNTSFLRDLLEHPDVVSGQLDTGLIERVMHGPTTAPIPHDVIAAAALIDLHLAHAASAHGDPWADRSGWRIGGAAWSTYRARSVHDHQIVVRHRGTSSGYEVHLDDGHVMMCSLSIADGVAFLDHDDVRSRLHFAVQGRTLWLGRQGETWWFTQAEPTPVGGATPAQHLSVIASPMPGTVAATPVAVGDLVTPGQAVVVVEAMKMEHTLRATFDGIVTELRVAVGDRVALNQTLAVLEPLDPLVPDESAPHR